MRIHILAATLACAAFVGCGGGSSPVTPPPTPPSPSLAVTAPKDGATVNGQPVTISVSASNISDHSQLAVLLNGADITSRLSAPDANGAQSVQVSQPDVNYGKNQVQVRYQDSRANSTFTLEAGTAGSAPPSGTGLGSELSVVTTRVLMPGKPGTSATDWGIQVGDDKPYWSPTPKDQEGNDCTQQCYGYQILLLSRQDLTLIPNGNMAFEVSNYDEIQPTAPFVQELSSLGQGNFDTPPYPGKIAPADCKPYGCIMVMQSLAQIGYNPCYNGTDSKYLETCPPFVQDPHAAGSLIYWLTKLGASGQNLFANGMVNPHVGYSFIGNVGSGQMPGAGAVGGTDSQGNIIVTNQPTTNGQYERMSCIDSRYQNPVAVCDNLFRAGSADSTDGNTDLQQAGRISGVFIRDNYNLFTFSQNAPQLTYNFGTTVSGGTYTNVVSINGSTTEGGGQYTMSMPSGSTGGFRLLILKRTHPDWADAKRWDKFYNCCNSNSNDLKTLISDIYSFPDANNLFFLASMGNIKHSTSEDDPAFAPQWENLVQALTVLGAEPMTVRILGDEHAAFDSDTKDDFLLVGKTTPNAAPDVENFMAGMPSQYTAQEDGYVINRHTLTDAPSPTQVEGILVADHQGYYTPQMQSLQQNFIVPQITAISSASLQPPVVWPYSAEDINANAGDKSAYIWISSQLCCADIRSTYINLNASPAVWLSQLDGLAYPGSSASFTEQEFTEVKDQLALEFAYVADTRNLQTNILSLYQDQQSNVSLILDQAASDIKSSIDLDVTLPVKPSGFSLIMNDILPVASQLSRFFPNPADGAAAGTAIALGTVALNSSMASTNDPYGASQAMHALANEEVAEGDLAQYEANQFANNLGTLGNDFTRIVTDWNRLKAVGGPIETGQLIWDPSATSVFLRAFDLTTRRQFYPTLMSADPNLYVTHISFGDVQYYGRSDHTALNSNNTECYQSEFWQAQDNLTGYSDNGNDLRGTAWWPGVLQVNPGVDIDPHHPPAYWWDTWALAGHSTNSVCPLASLPNTFSIFDPIAEDDTFQSNGLGLWKPYILQYRWVPQQNFNRYFTQWSKYGKPINTTP